MFEQILKSTEAIGPSNSIQLHDISLSCEGSDNYTVHDHVEVYMAPYVGLCTYLYNIIAI